MRKIIKITAIAILTLTMASCASIGAQSAGGHSPCGAYGNP